MTPEQRLDRTERIVILMAKAGYRARKEMRQYAREHAERMREQDENIHMLIQAQMETTEQIKGLAAGQARLDDEMAKLSRKRRNGKSD